MMIQSTGVTGSEHVSLDAPPICTRDEGPNSETPLHQRVTLVSSC